MGVVTDVMASFVTVCKTFDQSKYQQPFNQYITSILEVLVPILYALHWDVDNGTHNLVGLLLAEAPYVKKVQKNVPSAHKKARYL